MGNEPKFKVGDVVRCINDYGAHLNGVLRHGNRYTVLGIRDNGDRVRIFNSAFQRNERYLRASRFELAPKSEPAPKFKVGEGLSTYEYNAALPKRRYSHQAKGLPLYIFRTGHVVVPFEMTQGGHWNCVVLLGDQVYMPDGYNILMPAVDIEAGLDLSGAFEKAAGEAIELHNLAKKEESS
jgi:hypothetical protein